MDEKRTSLIPAEMGRPVGQETDHHQASARTTKLTIWLRIKSIIRSPTHFHHQRIVTRSRSGNPRWTATKACIAVSGLWRISHARPMGRMTCNGTVQRMCHSRFGVGAVRVVSAVADDPCGGKGCGSSGSVGGGMLTQESAMEDSILVGRVSLSDVAQPFTARLIRA